MTPRELHDRAMARAHAADRRGKAGERDDARRLFGEAFEDELAAARDAPTSTGRSILYRSAAWLAVQAARYQDGVDAADEGVAILASPPPDLAAAPDVVAVLRRDLLAARRVALAGVEALARPGWVDAEALVRLLTVVVVDGQNGCDVRVESSDHLTDAAFVRLAPGHVVASWALYGAVRDLALRDAAGSVGGALPLLRGRTPTEDPTA